MPSVSAPSILYLVINLPQAEKRRRSIMAQAERFGVNIQIVPAIEGKDLDLETDAHGYSHKMRRKYFTKDLLANEVACTLSHRKALEQYLSTDADYLVLLEDDAVLAEYFNEGICELTEHLKGWEAAKLYTDDGKIYPLCPEFEGAPVQPVMPKKLPWVSVGYMYTRYAAQKILDGMQNFWLPTDMLIARILLSGHIPTIGVSPGLIHSADPHNKHSTIDPKGVRFSMFPPRNLFQFLAYRISVLRAGLSKKCMRWMMRRRISRR